MTRFVAGMFTAAAVWAVVQWLRNPDGHRGGEPLPKRVPPRPPAGEPRFEDLPRVVAVQRFWQDTS